MSRANSGPFAKLMNQPGHFLLPWGGVARWGERALSMNLVDVLPVGSAISTLPKPGTRVVGGGPGRYKDK